MLKYGWYQEGHPAHKNDVLGATVYPR